MSHYYGGGFDEWMADSFFHDVPESKMEQIKKLLEPYRTTINNSLESFSNEEKSWRDTRNALWIYIPEDIQKAISVILETPRTRFERI